MTLNKDFMKVATCILLAFGLIFSALPVQTAHHPPLNNQTSISLKSEWHKNNNNNPNNIPKYEQKALLRRRHATVRHKQQNVDQKVWQEFIDHLILREGKRNTVYRDSLGKPTVGVGHLVRKQDNLKVGDTISDAQVREFLEQDAQKAFDAALKQATELGVQDSDFIIALGSVNFQLGTNWRSKFPNTWQHMVNGNFEQAIKNIEKSLWARQTPVRTKDFVQAIKNIIEQDTSNNVNVTHYSPTFLQRNIGDSQVAPQYG